MKWPMLWLAAALLIVPAAILPWAHKEVHDLDCSSAWHNGGIETRCTEDDWVVDYRLLSMATVHEWREDDGSGWTPIKRETWAYGYHGDIPHPEGGTPLLWVGPVVLATAIVSTGLAAWALWNPAPLHMLLARIGWATHLGAIAVFLAGMAIHSGTWTGDDVSLLAPRWGLLAIATTLLAGVPLLPERQEMPLGMPPLPS